MWARASESPEEKAKGQQGGGQQSGGQQASRNSTCNAAIALKVGQLSGGIRTNVAIQEQELISISTLQGILASNQSASEIKLQYETERQALMVIQKMGVEARTQNSVLAAEVQSPAQAGLKIVEGAQQVEIQQVSTLQGSRQADSDTLQLLSKEVIDGTRQNWLNLVTADAQCPRMN
ncbi:hypothetical protein DM02DRAFT_539277 [Periconia macrospinosa]|uniref:Uncharacterized protein n=1 Tax=Periconia macrospinosa TaxID=97972 RepID=A0A2V1D8R1_9PLEO|nr:hypothetical protein DM02DRAFT_539277 [Periconia macrospinosa]